MPKPYAPIAIVGHPLGRLGAGPYPIGSAVAQADLPLGVVNAGIRALE